MEFSLESVFSKLKGSGGSINKVVGIDIGSVAIKVVEIENRKDVLTLTTYGELQAGPYENKSVGESAVLSAGSQKTAMVDVLRESAVKAKSAVFAMPLSSSFVTIMSMNAEKDEDISSRIRVEARKYIPVPITDVTLDWAELSAGAKNGTRSILLAAIQNDELQKLQSLMLSISMKNQPTEIESFSTVRALFSEGDQSVATIDIGGGTTKLYVTKGGLLQRMHRVRAGGSMLTSRIANMLDVSFDEAEIRKREFKAGDSDARDILNATSSTFSRPLMEFKRVMDEYEKSSGENISKVILTGGGVLMSGMQKTVEETLQRETETADPFAKLAYPAFMEDTIKSIGPLFSVAVGSALRLFE